MEFNQFIFEKWVRKHLDHIMLDVEHGNLTYESEDELIDSLHEYMNDAIGNDCIYYADCVSIMREYGVWDWGYLQEEFGIKMHSVTDVAFYFLLSQMNEENVVGRIAEYVMEQHPIKEESEEE